VKLETGSRAPEFTAADQTGTVRTLDEFAGGKLIIYFYPKAFTPGCTTESCDFRDSHQHLAAQGYTILGVSPDTPEKLEKFRQEHDLPFDLLSDPEFAMARAYGAYGTKTNYGREYEGLIRSTFKIDGAGAVEEAFYNVRAKGHVARIETSIDA
jgi:peroxiredoxin Q/BCP